VQLIDTHTHLDFEMFDDDRAQVIARSQDAGVERIVVLGVHEANWQRVWQLACRWGLQRKAALLEREAQDEPGA